MLKRLLGVGVLALGFAVPSAHAGPITELNGCGTLADMIANGCTIGDKLFSNVTWQASFGVDGAQQAATIEVVGITDGDLGANFGFRLQGIGGAPLPEVPDIVGDDFLFGTLRYDVSVLDPSAFLITDMHLSMEATPGVLGVVTLRVSDENGNPVGGTLCAEASPIECAFFGTPDTDFQPLDRIKVETAIGLETQDGQVNYIDQIVTQQAQLVPEPTMMLLFGTGLLGAGVRRWRQNRA